MVGCDFHHRLYKKQTHKTQKSVPHRLTRVSELPVIAYPLRGALFGESAVVMFEVQFGPCSR